MYYEEQMINGVLWSSTVQIGNFPVPRNKLAQFQEIFAQTGCRYTSKPYWCGDTLRVSFEPGDYAAFQDAWQRVTTPIREIDRRPGWLRKLWRRAKAKLLHNTK